MKYKYLLIILISAVGNLFSQQLIHNFEFNGNFNDTEPTGTILTEFNTTTSSFGTNPNEWTWTSTSNPGGGLVLLSELQDPQSYSIGFRIEFTETTPGYRKIISFKGASNDPGLYFLDQKIVLFPFSESAPDYVNGVFYDFVLTRDSTDDIKVYIVDTSGTVIQIYDTQDASDDSVPVLNGGKYEFRFFIDDTATNNEYTSGGSVRSIRLWDAPLSPAEISGALSSVTTGIVENITTTAATINGSVNPQGTAATFSFEYGATTAYGSTVAPTPSSDSGSTSIDVQATISGLSLGTTYHYRLKSTNINGDAFGDDKIFTTIAPGGVVGSSLWLDANNGATHSGANLTGWSDVTGTNTFTQVGTSGYVSGALNFNPVVSFNNTDAKGVLPSNRLDGDTNITYIDGFAVYKYTSTTDRGALIGGTASNTNYGKVIFSADNDLRVYVGNGINQTYLSYLQPNSDNTFSVSNLDISLITTPFATGRLNGTNQTITVGPNGGFANLSLTPMIGGTNNVDGNNASFGWYPFFGEVAEIILFPTSLSIPDKIRVESYLALKYGIHKSGNYINSNFNVVWNATANSTFHNDVFGIGRDDVSSLMQTSSNSMNTGSGDGTGQSGLGNVILSNASSLDNNDYLLIGNDAGALTEVTTDLPALLTGSSRLAREWKISHTNDVGTTNLLFDVTGLTVAGTTAAEFKLLIDTDGNGNFTDGLVDIIDATNFIAGIHVSFPNVTLPHNAVFAIVTKQVPLNLNDDALDISKIYPNPTNGSFTIKFNNSINNATINIYNTFGQLVFKSKVDSSNQADINLNVKTGVYFIKIVSENITITKHLIIK